DPSGRQPELGQPVARTDHAGHQQHVGECRRRPRTTGDRRRARAGPFGGSGKPSPRRERLAGIRGNTDVHADAIAAATGRRRSVSRRGPVEVTAGGIVAGVRYGYARRLGRSVVAVAATVVARMAFLVCGGVDAVPTAETYRIRVHFDESGGLLPGRDVTLRGVPVGTVSSVDLTEDGVAAVAEIDSRARIPAGGEIRVAGLSLAGEQYLDLRPDSDDGPYLEDGAEISAEDTSTPVPLSTLMHDLDGMLAQIDPDSLQVIVEELGVGPD